MVNDLDKYSDAEDGETEEYGATLLELVNALEDSQAGLLDSEASKKLNEALIRKFKEEAIPNHLGSAEEWTGLGIKVKIKESLFASIKKDMQEQAFQHLESIDKTEIVKRAITINFGGGTVLTNSMLEAVMPELQALVEHKLTLLAREAHTDPETGEVRPITIESSITKGYTVHKSTLGKLAKDMQEKGDYLPSEIFHVFNKRVANVTHTN